MTSRRSDSCLRIPIIGLLVLGVFPGLARGDDPGLKETRVDWPAFLGQHDMIFERLPKDWTEAPHFGNAILGSMLYQTGDTLTLQVFRADVHDHRDSTHGWTAYSRPRLQIGHFSLHTVGKPTGCRWRKDLWNAEMTGTITTQKGEIRIRHFVHSKAMVIVTELTPSAGERGFSWTWHPAEARTTRPGYPKNESEIETFAKKYGSHYKETLKPYQPNPRGRLELHGKEPGGRISVWIQDLLAGGQYATAWTEKFEGDTHVHLATITKSSPAATAAESALSSLQDFNKQATETWRKTHHDWWHSYYPRSYIDLPDEKLESLYWQTIYRFGCTSRTGRGFVDTAGLWFQGKSWPYFTADWNIQSAHWPVYAANRLDQGQELLERLHQKRGNLIRAVRPVEWQEDSAYLSLAVAGDLVGGRDEDMRYFDLIGNLPWAMHNAWWQYRYAMDEPMLREKVYPLLRRAINLYLHMVQERPDGHLRLPPTYSPETGVYEDCNFDLALLKWGCHTLLVANERLKLDDPLAPRWREIIRRLPDFPADKHGFMLGRNQTSSPNHQHFSNLLMIYPLYLVNVEQPGTMDVLRRSFERARSTAGPGQRQAMVQAHAGPIATALRLGDEALDCLRKLQADLHPNGLWYESPCIESSLAAANIIQDMLLQSWSDPAAEAPGPIRIFPALPSGWKDVEFQNLRAEGAFLVSARREGGRIGWVRIKSLAGEPCRVRHGIEGAIGIQLPDGRTWQETSPGLCEIELRKNEEALIFPAGKRQFE